MSALSALLAPLRRRVMLLVGRGIVRLVEEAVDHQALQIELVHGELRDRVPHFQNFGTASRPLPGSRAVAVFLGGSRSHGIVVAVDDPEHRPKDLQGGEACLYNAFGVRITAKADGSVLISGASKLRVEGDLEVTGDVKDHADGAGVSMLDMRLAYNAHTHPGGAGSPPAPQMVAP